MRQRDPGSTFWQQDTTVAKPTLQGASTTSPPFWVGGVIADPDQLAPIQNAFGGIGLALQLEFPLNLGGVNGDQAPRGCTAGAEPPRHRGHARADRHARARAANAR